MQIRITRGIYGFRENGNVVEKTRNDPPFEVDAKEGKRLVSLRVAECVEMLPEQGEIVTESENNADEGSGSRAGYIARSELEGMSREELVALAEKFGVKKNCSKADLVERLSQCPVSVEEDELLDETEVPELSAEEPD